MLKKELKLFFEDISDIKKLKEIKKRTTEKLQSETTPELRKIKKEIIKVVNKRIDELNGKRFLIGFIIKKLMKKIKKERS